MTSSILALIALALLSADPRPSVRNVSPRPSLVGGGDGFGHPLLWRQEGRGTGDNFGVSLSRLGDVDGDGVADVVVGAWLDDELGGASGSVSVLSGADGGEIHRLLLGTPGDRFGFAVDGVGDLDQDGYDDFVVGAPDDDPRGFQSGTVFVFSGLDASILFRIEGDQAEQQLGYAVAGIGDADGDGIGDFAVGGDESDSFDAGSGFARLYSGATGRLLRRFVGPNVNSSFGEALAAAGDVDLDGHADWLVGAHGAGTAGPVSGLAIVYSGADGTVLHRVHGAPGNHFGSAVSGAGDMNFDRHAEFMVASLLDDGARGSVKVFDGATGELLHDLSGGEPDIFGRKLALACAGDLDLDGRDDFLVGDSCDLQLLCGRPGRVRAYSGLDASLLGAVDGLRNDQLGFALDSMGDLDGDRIPDFVVGAFRADIEASDAGAVLLFSGSPFPRRPLAPPARRAR